MRNFLVFFLISSTLLLAVYHHERIKNALISFFDSSQIAKPVVIHWPTGRIWDIQSIDTMKYSRDLAREKLNDPAFDEVIKKQVNNIAATGANYIAIATPYDEEFFPILSIWVAAARDAGLHIWFRGNWSGWEGWFGYVKIDRKQHTEKTLKFIENHQDIFEKGDIFSACPECENGGPGDPRQTKDVNGFRHFIIDEYRAAQMAFQKINKDVSANYYPMNADVARLVMDRETTKSMGGIVVIDHYVKSPEVLMNDIRILHEKSGGNIVLGEFGAPIPGVHGKMSEAEQAQWIDSVLSKLVLVDGIRGVNYWSNVGGTTGIWDRLGKPSLAVAVLENHFKPKIFFGVVLDEKQQPISDAKILYKGKEIRSLGNGYFEATSEEVAPLELQVSAPGFLDTKVLVREFGTPVSVVLKKEAFSWNNPLVY